MGDSIVHVIRSGCQKSWANMILSSGIIMGIPTRDQPSMEDMPFVGGGRCGSSAWRKTWVAARSGLHARRMGGWETNGLLDLKGNSND